jgi:hypothetical protein
MVREKIIQIMPCNVEQYSCFDDKDNNELYKHRVLGFLLIENEKGYTYITTFSQNKEDNIMRDDEYDNFIGYEFPEKTLGILNEDELKIFEKLKNKEFTKEEMDKLCSLYDGMEMQFQSEKKILDIVMKYADKFKGCWGIEEFVHQDNRAMEVAINLFGEIIGALPRKQEDEADGE